MSVNLEIRKKLSSDAIVFDNFAYDNSIIGMTFDGRAIYEYNRMAHELSKDNCMSIDEAMEWIDYNTIRALNYISGKKPIIVYDDAWFDLSYENFVSKECE